MQIIDKAVFEELQSTVGADFVTELVATFAEEAAPLLADLRAARQTADADHFRRAAHTLKSNGATFGATELEALARTLERAGLAADPAADEAAIAALQAALNRAVMALQELAHG